MFMHNQRNAKWFEDLIDSQSRKKFQSIKSDASSMARKFFVLFYDACVNEIKPKISLFFHVHDQIKKTPPA